MFQQPSDTPFATVSTPAWVAITALVISAVLAAVRVYEFIVGLYARADLTATLTQDVFVRIGDLGEHWFLNAVLSGTDRAALVQEVKARLSRVDGTQVIPLKFSRLGEPTNRGYVIHDHYFFSSSPTDLVPVDTPTRRVLMLMVESSEAVVVAAYQELELVVYGNSDAIKAAAASNVAVDELPEPQATQAREAIAALNLARQHFVNRCFDAVQLRGGEYTLTVEWFFRDAKKRSQVVRTRKSSLTFVMDDDFRTRLRADLERAAVALVQSIVFRDSSRRFHPETKPKHIRVNSGQ